MGWGYRMKNDGDVIRLMDGEAAIMGDGVVTVMQRDGDGLVHSVVLGAEDLRALLAAL